MSERYIVAKEKNLMGCHSCAKLVSDGQARCGRCGSAVHYRKPNSLQMCVALSLTSAIAYIPANLMPIMIITDLGSQSPSTIMAGVIGFWESHAYPVAIIIFIASIVIPCLKLLALALLCAAASGKFPLKGRHGNLIFWLTETVGRWSMIDVFVVAILVSLVQWGEVSTIESGPATVAFGLTVILTMVASHAFDPKLIWDQVREQESNQD